MALDWLVQPSEPAREPVLLGAEYQPYYAAASFQHDVREAVGRLSVYPAIVWPKDGLHASRQQFFASDRFTFATAPVQVWKAIFPDLLPRLTAPGGQSVWIPLVNLPPAPALAAAVFPAWIPRPRRGYVVEGELVPNLFPTTVVTFGWRGDFPDLIARLTVHPSALTHSVGSLHAVLPRDFEWRTTHPDQLLPPTRVILEAARFDPEPIPNPPAPELSWQWWQPDHIAPLESLRAYLQQAWASDRIRPVSPDLAWQGRYPDQIGRTVLSAAAMPSLTLQQVVLQPDLRMDWQASPPEVIRPAAWRAGPPERPLEVPVSPVVWLSEMPERPMVRRQVGAPSGTFSPGTLIVIGERQGWQVPQPLLATRSVVSTMQSSVRPLLPETELADNLWCIRFSDDVILGPELSPAWAMTPALTDEAVLTPKLTDEEVC